MKKQLTTTINNLILRENQKMSTVDTFSDRGPKA